MAPVGEEGSADVAAGAPDAVEGPGGLGIGKSSYVPPHMRGAAGAAAGGERMGGKFAERDDLATLRVTNVRLQTPGYDLESGYANTLLGFRACRGGRAPRTLLEIRSRHKSLPCQGPRNRYGQGLRLHFLHKPRRRCEGLLEHGWLWFQALDSPRRVCQEGYLNGWNWKRGEGGAELDCLWRMCTALDEAKLRRNEMNDTFLRHEYKTFFKHSLVLSADIGYCNT